MLRCALTVLPLLGSMGLAPGGVPHIPAPTTTRVLAYPFVDGSTFIGFQGTALEPSATGEASVRGEGGRMRIHAHFKKLGPADRLGPAYRTYVLWAVSPLGRAVNLGEVVPRAGRAHVEAMTGLPSFALVVTAEPHFAVTRMSRALVLENAATAETRAGAEEAPFDLLDRASYTLEAGDASEPPYARQARAAVHIARSEQAEALAPAEFGKALQHLERMEGEGRLAKPRAVLLARQTVQLAEDARQVAEKRREAQRASEAETAVREASARAEAAQARADSAQAQAESAQAQADFARTRAGQEAQRARAASEVARRATEGQLALRQRLLADLRRVLDSRETDEGLRATLTFPPGSSRLSRAARERLAQVAGILLAQPGLKVRILGHTDATGSAAFNARLALQRAEGVRSFLVSQGVAPGAAQAQGGAGAPPDERPGERRLNRRVDLLVSGEPIGISGE